MDSLTLNDRPGAIYDMEETDMFLNNRPRRAAATTDSREANSLKVSNLWKSCTKHCVTQNSKKLSSSSTKSDFALPSSNGNMLFAYFPRLLSASCSFLALLTLLPWIWMWCVPPKRRLTFTGLHSVLSVICPDWTIYDLKRSLNCIGYISLPLYKRYLWLRN
jgi:hypothetical protein